jgi:uncharacterized membrane protein
MNQAHVHLAINHLPIILPIAGVLIVIGGLIFRSELVKRMGYFLFIVGAIATFPSMNSGEGAEEIAENIAGVTEGFIHEHEEKAEVFAIFSYILGALSLFGIWVSWKAKSFSNTLSLAIVLFASIVLFLGKQTGTTGGEIRHTEIRTDQAVQSAGEAEEEHED